MASVRFRCLIVLLLVVVTIALERPTAVRAFGTPPPIDPTPEALLQYMGELVDELVAAGELNSGQGRALSATLDAAAANLEQGNTTAAINNVQAFIHQVEAFIQRGILSQADGDVLLDAAETLIDELSS
jgi:hypothetical protein